MNTLNALGSFAKAAYPVLLAVLPSLIVAFSKYPRAAGLLSSALKLLNMFSVLTHSDSPGTMKMPLTMSTSPEGHSNNVTPLALIPMLVIGSLLAAGCACSNPVNATKFACRAENALIDCSMASAAPAIAQALQDVAAAISGSEIDWTALARAEGTYGIGIVACAIQKLDSFAPQSAKPKAFKSKLHAHAKEYLAKRKLHLK